MKPICNIVHYNVQILFDVELQQTFFVCQEVGSMYVCVLRAAPAIVAAEMIRVVGVIFEEKWLLLDDGVTLLTHVLAHPTGLLTVVARTTQVPDGRSEKESK
jgi:hypothetical protein